MLVSLFLLAHSMLSAVGTVRISLTIGQRPTIEQKPNQLLVCCNDKFKVRIISGEGNVSSPGNKTQITSDGQVIVIVEPI